MPHLFLEAFKTQCIILTLFAFISAVHNFCLPLLALLTWAYDVHENKEKYNFTSKQQCRNTKNIQHCVNLFAKVFYM